MNDDIAIKVENVSKKFSRSLKRSMLYGVKDIGRNALGMGSRPEILRKEEFWAVNNVSFEVKKGEALGLIGPNGSGKSTLLKMLNGIYWPDKGKITINGRVGALIAVGAGFHPMLTGRENIFTNAAILGMTKKETDAKLDDIINFADIGDFLDTPVKFYSSGMYVRLGFAVAVHCEPDILLVDEVLAVGDAGFRIKCLNKILKILDDVSVVFVSHSMPYISRVCTKGLLLKNEHIFVYGEINDIIDEYTRLFISGKDTLLLNTKSASISEIHTTMNNNGKYYEITSGESLSIDFIAEIEKDIETIEIILFIYTRDQEAVAIITEKFNRIIIQNKFEKMKLSIEIPNLHLSAGNYYFTLNIMDAKNKTFIYRNDGIIFHVLHDDIEYSHVPNRIDAKWIVQKVG